MPIKRFYLKQITVIGLAVMLLISLSGCSGAPKSIIGNVITQQYAPSKQGREMLDSFDIQNKYTRTINDEEVNVYEYTAKFLPSEAEKNGDKEFYAKNPNNGGWKDRYPVYQVTGTIYIVKRGSEWYDLSSELSEHYHEQIIGYVCGEDNHPCSDSENNQSSYSSQSKPTDAADLTTDNNSKPTASPAQLSQALPFIGDKSFNFDGGEATITLITIQPDGTVILKEPSGGEGVDQKFSVSFKGKFTNPLLLNQADDTSIQFKDGKVYHLIHGQPDTSCMDVQTGKDNIPCVSELSSLN